MSYLNGSNDWGKGTDESFGDMMEEELEDKAKEKVKKQAEKEGKEAFRAVKTAAKNATKVIRHPIEHLKAAIQKVKKKAKEAAKKLSEEGIKAVVKAFAKAMKGLCSWIVRHPISSIVIFLILYMIFSNSDIEMDGGDSDADYNSYEYDSADLTDEDIVVILMEDCIPQEPNAPTGELDSDKNESAQFIYSVFRSYGFNNASIAGMLGNIDIESGLDSSAIEGIYDEYGYIGPKKSEALLSMSDYTVNTLFPKYETSGISINRDGYKAVNSSGVENYYCGMGLIQWTGGGAQDFLSAAETVHMTWYTMEFQLAYMLSDSIYRPGFFSEWVQHQEEGNDINAARASAVYFAHGYEGNSSNDDERENAAEEWFGIINAWDDSQINEEFVDSIGALATQLGGLIDFIDIADTADRCGTIDIFDNSSLATAAVAYAWPTKEQSYNNGTNLYQAVINGIWPGDHYFKACDRTVAGAVRWSGTDDDYPLSTANQLDYLAASPKWELVGMADSLTMNDLKSGDVFIVNGHTLIYVGESAIMDAYAGEAVEGSNSVSASLDERSASCNTDVTYYMNNGGSDSNGIYYVYRCITPDNSSTYSDIGSGVSN